MFSLKIVDSDAFLDMGQTAQLLYFHLSMRADDDGFIGNPKKIMRMIGSSDDDMKVLLSKRFLLPFDSGIVVIKHWKIHNYIQNDRYSPTQYTEEMKTLKEKENGAYTECIQNVYTLETQVRVGKARIGKDRVDTIVSEQSSQDNKDVQEIFDVFYTTVNPTIQFQNKTQRNAAKELIKRLGKEKAIKAAQYAVTIQARGDKYCPRITTPVQLLNKHGELQVYYSQNSQSNVATI